MVPRWIIGLASGSSADAVDAILLEVEGVGLDMQVRLRQAIRQPHGTELRDLIRSISSNTPTEARQFSLLNRLLGETFAAAARAVADRASVRLQEVMCVGCPGQVVWHEVEGRFPSTLSLGMPAVIAERLGVTTVSDFRDRDLAAGGLGMPLEPLVDYLLFRSTQEQRVLIHLNSVARVVSLPMGARLAEIQAFEAGPCNSLLDALMRHLTHGREGHDSGGRNAVQGKCIESLLQTWLNHPYFQRRPPKCLPRQQFGDDFISNAIHHVRESQTGSLHDLLCTATHFIAHVIIRAVGPYLPMAPAPCRLLLTGGGIRNGFLWHLLEQQLPGRTLQRTDDVGIPAPICKALMHGILAVLALDGVAANLPWVTGSGGSRILGSFSPGSTSNWARCLTWMAHQIQPTGLRIEE